MNDARLTAFGQDVYLARHGELNDVSDANDLATFQANTASWINQLIPEIEKAKNPAGKLVDWNWLRTYNDTSIGVVSGTTGLSYQLPTAIRRLVINAHRDLSIRQDSTVISTFRLVNPNQLSDPSGYDTRARATVINRQIIFSRALRGTEIGGTIVADTIAFIPQLIANDTSLLDIFDNYPDIRQLFVLGVIKNQTLPDIVQGGLTPSFSGKFDSYLADCVAENNLSADADDADRESFGNIRGIGM